MSRTFPFDNAVVLGAGLMGRLVAWQLARAGCAVELHEAQGPDAMGAAARVADDERSVAQAIAERVFETKPERPHQQGQK